MRSRPSRPEKDLLRQPTSRCRIDDPLSFWGQWFSNRRVSPVFRPSLTIHLSVIICDGGGASGNIYKLAKNGIPISTGLDLIIPKSVIADSGEYSFGGSYSYTILGYLRGQIVASGVGTGSIGPTKAKIEVLRSAPLILDQRSRTSLGMLLSCASKAGIHSGSIATNRRLQA
jgi:hypothetical protein